LADSNLSRVSSKDLPGDLVSSIESLKEKLPQAISATGEINRWSDVFLQVFGHEQVKKYILVFQNTAEARATGGFIGSYGIWTSTEAK